MSTLAEQQAKAWSLAPDDVEYIGQSIKGKWRGFYSLRGQGVGYFFGDRTHVLFTGEVNGWDWHDTLQSREEWEAMQTVNEEFEVQDRTPHGPVGLPITEQIEKDEKWTPEVGQECEFVYDDDICMDIDGPMSKWQTGDRLEIVAEREETCIVWNKIRGTGCSINDELLRPIQSQTDKIRYRPIQSEADKMRDQYIESLAKALCTGNESSWMCYEKEAEFLVDSGWVNLDPDEYVVKPLTDEQREELKKLFSLEAISQDPDAFIDAVLREAGLIEEK